VNTLQAILILGPTGAGKSPLGDWFEAHGLWGRRCHHFDFGAHLRATAVAGPCDRFPADDIAFLHRVLHEGALLENESFHIAETILDAFISQRGIVPSEWLLLNGLPRHVGQAQALESRLRITAVLQLECGAHVIGERLRLNTGGDRAQRTDDDGALVARKLATYVQHTRPLLEHYRRQGARLIEIPVNPGTQPFDIADRLEPPNPRPG
jgi:adenylate kinase